MHWLDQPLALWCQHVLPNSGTGWLTAERAVMLTQLLYCLMLPVFLLYYWFAQTRPQQRITNCLTLLSLSVPISFFTKSCLQFLLGRITPRYSGSHVLLFTRNPNLYGFHWLQPGSFPSGHMAVLVAAGVAIALYYRWFWWVVIPLSTLLGISLLLTNYHFLSDVIAGAYLGSLLSIILYRLQLHHRHILL